MGDKNENFQNQSCSVVEQKPQPGYMDLYAVPVDCNYRKQPKAAMQSEIDNSISYYEMAFS